MRQYSHFFSVLYDEPGPVGNLGRCTHHSVIRIFSRRPGGRFTGIFNDVAIIWDEDHDTRVITAIEIMIINGLVHGYDILFIGERKGMLSIIVREMAPDILATVEGRLDSLPHLLDDPWTISVQCLSDIPDHSIINDDQRRVSAYLHGIDALWALGNKAAYINLRERMRRGSDREDVAKVENDNFVAATMSPLSFDKIPKENTQ